MSVHPLPASRPSGDALASIERALDVLGSGGWEALTSEELAAASQRLMRIEARVKAQQLVAARVLEQRKVARREGATSTGALLAGSFGQDRAAADRAVRVARELEPDSATERAMSAGDLGLAQVEAIAGAMANLPAEYTPQQRQQCEQTLIAQAPELSIKELRLRGDRITDLFDEPEIVDATEQDTLVTRERAARAKTTFWMRDNQDGTVTGGFTLPEAQADMLKTVLDANAAPRRRHLDAEQRAAQADLTYSQRLGRGFLAMIEHFPTDGFATTGGTPATVMVTLDHDTLVEGVGAATLSTGTRLSAGEARRLACDLKIIPAVYGGASIPLDLGRGRREFTTTQRHAFAARGHGCEFDCDRPPGWTEAHHADHWENGGKTDLARGVLLCAYHHHLVHDDGWDIRFTPDDRPLFRAPGATEWQDFSRYRAEKRRPRGDGRSNDA